MKLDKTFHVKWLACRNCRRMICTDDSDVLNDELAKTDKCVCGKIYASSYYRLQSYSTLQEAIKADINLWRLQDDII